MQKRTLRVSQVHVHYTCILIPDNFSINIMYLIIFCLCNITNRRKLTLGWFSLEKALLKGHKYLITTKIIEDSDKITQKKDAKGLPNHNFSSYLIIITLNIGERKKFNKGCIAMSYVKPLKLNSTFN